jgi:hypothetical protein
VFLDLGIQRVTGMRRIVVCGLPGSALFPHVITKTGTIFEKVMIKNVYWSSCEIDYPLVLSNFNETWHFWTDSRKILRF